MHFKSEQLNNGIGTHFIEDKKTFLVIFIADSIKTIWTWPDCFQEQSHGPVHFLVFSSSFQSITWARNCRAMIMSQLIEYRSQFWIPTEQEFHIQAKTTVYCFFYYSLFILYCKTQSTEILWLEDSFEDTLVNKAESSLWWSVVTLGYCA